MQIICKQKRLGIPENFEIKVPIALFGEENKLEINPVTFYTPRGTDVSNEFSKLNGGFETAMNECSIGM